MPRQQVSQPLEGAAPTLQPTARPIAITLGATPPPERSPLLELGNAFKDFDPELRDMLRDASAREEKNAQAIGEIEATKARAAGRMAELNTILKQKVDSGELSRVHLPAAQHGASLRTGIETAEVGFQTEILNGLQSAIKGGPEATEQVIADGLKKYADALPASDFYARKGFDHASQAIIESFRQRVAEGQAAEFDRVSKQSLADMGSELALRLATADEAAAPLAHSDFRRHIEQVRQELPKSEVNGFVAQNIIAPAVVKLTDQRKFAEARQLLDESEKLDVTGKGGLLSQTNAAKTTFAQLRDHVDQEARTETHTALDAYRADREMRVLKGADAAGAQLQRIRLNSGGGLPQDGTRFNIIDQFRRENPTDSVLVDSFADAVNTEWEHEDKFRADERTVSDLALQANTLDKDKLAHLENAVEAQYRVGAVPASARSQLLELIGKRKVLSGAIDEQDFRSFKREVFAVPQGNLGETTVNFGGGPGYDQWDKLNPTAQDGVAADTTAYFKEQLERSLIVESKGDPNQIASVKAIALEKATLKAREFAKASVAKALTDQTKLNTKATIAKQASAINQARVVIPSRSTMSSLMGNLNEPQEFVTTRDKVAKGIKNAPTHTYKFTPTVGPDLEKAVKAQATTPQSEWDVVATPDYFRYTRQRQDALHIPEVLDMKQLAEEINAKGTLEDGEGNPTRVAAAKRYYGIAKGLLGFTPEEIKAGKTKHGVEFDSAQIDYKTIPVFRSVGELEREWNKGDFSQLFGEVGDAIDPKNKLYPEDLYKAQLAILSSRK